MARREAIIGDLHKLESRLEVRCWACGHRVTLTPAEAVKAFGWGTTVNHLRNALVCSGCGIPAREGFVEVGLQADDHEALVRREGLDEHPEAVKTRYPGRRRGVSHRMAWQGSLGQMQAYRTIVKCTCEGCGKHRELDVDHLVEVFGSEVDLWDRWAVCPGCGGRVFFMATTSHSTPTRPLLTSGDPNHWTPLPIEGLEFIRCAPEKASAN